MTSSRRHFFAGLAAFILVGIGSHARAQLVSDVSVTLTANPSQGLAPGAPFTLTLHVTNEGLLPKDRVNIVSSPLWPDEVDISQSAPDRVGMRVAVADTPVGHFYLMIWYLGFDPSPPLLAGEQRTCHITMNLAANAPPTVTISFGLSEIFSDENPANDIGTVQLRRAVAQATPVPSASAVAVASLVLLVGVAGMAGLRQRRRSTLDRL